MSEQVFKVENSGCECGVRIEQRAACFPVLSECTRIGRYSVIENGRKMRPMCAQHAEKHLGRKLTASEKGAK